MKILLRTKFALGIIISAVVLSGVSITVSSRVIGSLIDGHFKNKAIELARTVTLITDLDSALKIKSDILTIYNKTPKKILSDQWGTREFNDYVDRFDSVFRNAVFKSLHNTLHAFQTANNVQSVYLAFVDNIHKTLVYMVDASDDPCPPGCVDALDINAQNLQLLNDPEIGFPPFITNTKEYGWLVTAGVPVYEHNHVVCYAMVDISMEEVRSQQIQFVMMISTILVIITILICALGVHLVDVNIAKPIRTLTTSAAHYCAEESATEHYIFTHINVHTNDELEELTDSMKQMEKDLNSHIKSLLQTTRELKNTREKADQMTKLAQKDALTGVRNKTAYLKEIKDLDEQIVENNAEFGIAMIDMNYLKTINDDYGHEKGDIALQKLCQLICTTFSHSPVFRIGGDEFVVVLKKDDYINHKNLEQDLFNRLDALQKDQALSPWEKLSCALGIAVFEKDTDLCVEDVFKRADETMYEHKKRMKAERV